MTYWLAFTVGLPTLVQGYVLGLLTLTFGFTRYPRFDGPLLVTDWRPWWGLRWHYCTTIGAWQGRPVWFNKWTDWHEDIHLMQFVDENAKGLVLGACLTPWLGWKGLLIIWGTSGAAWLLPNYITAAVRYWRPGVSFMDAVYKGSGHEDHAYDSTEVERSK